MNQKLMTPETKLILLENTEKKLENATEIVSATRELIKKTEILNSLLKANGFDAGFEKIISLLEFRLLVGILLLDLTSAVRIYLNAKFHYEGVYSARQIFVIINEGYKKLYNFILKDRTGNDKFNLRNDSFWKKEIGCFIESDLLILKLNYDNITIKLDDYLNNCFGNIKDLRDLSIHYGETAKDKNPVKVYDMIIKVDIEKTFQRMIPFLDILNEMFIFTNLMVVEYNKVLDEKKNNQDETIDNILLMLEKLSNKNKDPR